MSDPSSVDGGSDLGTVAAAVYAQLRIDGQHVAHMSRDVRERFIAAVRSRAARDRLKVSADTKLPDDPARRRMLDRLGRSSPTEFTLLGTDGQRVAPDAHLQPPPKPPIEYPSAEQLAELLELLDPWLTFVPDEATLRTVYAEPVTTNALWGDNEALLELVHLLETNHTKEQQR